MRSLKNLGKNKNLIPVGGGVIPLPNNVNTTLNLNTNINVRFVNLPTTSENLGVNYVWRDENGFLRIV